MSMRENMGVFRGRRTYNGEWVEGFLVNKTDPLLGIKYWFILVQEYDTSCIDGKPTRLESEMTWYMVDPETVSECSGVPDRNGKMMFEGDTVKGLFLWEKEILSTVAFENGSFGLRWMRGNVETFNPFTSMCNVKYEIVEQEGE